MPQFFQKPLPENPDNFAVYEWSEIPRAFYSLHIDESSNIAENNKLIVHPMYDPKIVELNHLFNAIYKNQISMKLAVILYIGFVYGVGLGLKALAKNMAPNPEKDDASSYTTNGMKIK
jgi:hypothetical protein